MSDTNLEAAPLDLTPRGSLAIEYVVNGPVETNTYFVISGGEALVIQFHSDGTPSTWASPWVLWGLLLMAVFSLLAASYPRRPSPGQKPLNPETACALFCGLSWLISLVALTLAIYALLPIPAVFYIGMVAAVLVIPLFLLVAALRRRRGSSPAG